MASNRGFIYRDKQVLGFILLGWWFCIKGPRSEPLFSERYGYEKWRHLGFGWRFKFRKMKGQ